MDVKKPPTWTMDANVNKVTGEFKRAASQFRRSVTADSRGALKAERDRYHLYVSLACPWACRTLIMRKLKGLEDVISVDVVHYYLSAKSWHFDDSEQAEEDCTSDRVKGHHNLSDIYHDTDPEYKGRYTVPCLFDLKEGKIVNNESSEIIRMLNSEFNEFCKTPEHAAADYYPEHLREKIDELNDWIYDGINNGVYKAGFATTQEAYEKAVKSLFASLDRVEKILSKNRYLAGQTLTEADIRLYTTLIRFDPVYVGHFKCNIRRIIDYPNMWNYLKELYQMPAFGSTTNMAHIKRHYYMSHVSINPTQVVPMGPDITADLESKHDRDRL